MRIGRVVGIVLGIVLILFGTFSIVAATFSDRIFDKGMVRLDAWVHSGGPTNTFQTEVVQTCGHMVFMRAGWLERWELLTIYRDRRIARIDLCTKATVNRIRPLAEFKNPKKLRFVCTQGFADCGKDCAEFLQQSVRSTCETDRR